jgi:tetratricopeptide (TPR) repeat protein
MPMRQTDAEPASARSMLGTFALLAGVILALFAVDTLLAGVEHQVRRGRAVQRYSAGWARLAAGDVVGAIEQFHAAISADRANAEYRRALARALLAADKPREADSLLVRLLRRDASDAEANLLLARARARQGRWADAASHYRRAIHGEWTADTARRRIDARLELIELLARRDSGQQLLAELLPLEVEAPGDTAIRRRLGHLYIQAGSPARSAEVFRKLVAARGDADAFAGLGRAEFELGNYRAAEASFRKAAALRPGDPGLAAALKLVATVRALDPTLRGLAAADRLRRSRSLLRLAKDAAVRCAGDSVSPGLQIALDSAAAALAAQSRPLSPDVATETNLALAERLAQARGEGCPEQALDLVMRVLSR